MARTKHGHSWIERHIRDPYVQKAQSQGYRSRASFKLSELNSKDKLFKPGQWVLDLGAAPGGWSQVLASLLGPKGKVIAVDLLEMDSLPGVEFLQGDFCDEEAIGKIIEILNGRQLDWVISDMSPNISGIAAVDQPRIIGLAECVLDFARQVLKPGGGLLVKVFQGVGFSEFHKLLKNRFRQVAIRKPTASRSSSSELYVLARDYYNI